MVVLLAGFINQQELMAQSFKNAMAKLVVLGNNPLTLIDYSDVVPTPKPAVNKPATFAATTCSHDLELTCKTEKFSTLTTNGEYDLPLACAIDS